MLEKVQVTGSNIKRLNLETASPVQIITREELTRGGATSLNEVLRTISSNVGGIDENRSNGFSAGAAGLNLRGIGSQATLMLINGRRLAAYAQPEFQTTFVDLNSIPVGAVERIEILKDGASAIYGSEAMAGVVNIILRNSFEGVEIGGSIAESAYKDGQQKRGTVSVGYGSLVEDHFNAYATLDLRQRKPMYIGNRPDYIGTQDWSSYGYRDLRNLYTFPGNIYWTDKATGQFTSRTLDKNCPANRLVPASVFFGAGATGQACVFDDLKDGTYNSAGKTDRLGLTSRVTWQPNEDTTVFGELMFNRNKALVTGNLHWVAGQTGQPTPALPITHPQYPQELIGPDGKTLAGGNGTVRVRAQLLDFPGQGQDNTTDFTRYLLGAKGSLKSWDWESALLVTGSKVTSYNSSAILTTPFVNAYKNGTFIFGGTTQNAALYQAISTTSASSFESGMSQWDAKLSGELMALPAGPLSFAGGVEMRRETLSTNPDPNSVLGELYHQAQSPPGFSNGRNIASIYSELSIPILKSLEAQFAFRHDKYSDYGSSTTPKLGLKWNATPSLLFRSTYAEGFRAPTLVENSTDVRNAFLSFRDPERCNATFKAGCSDQSPYQSGANPDLQPETARSWTFGIVLEPTSWLNVSVDFWRILRKNEIGTYDISAVLANPARYAGDPAVAITRDPLTPADKAAGATAGEVTNIKSLLTNVGLTDIRGIDLDLRGKLNMGEYGRLEPKLNVTLTDSYLNAPSTDDDLIEYAGTRGTPRYQATLGLGWKKAPWAFSADIAHIGTMSSQGDYTQPCTVGVEGYADLCNGIASFNTVNLGGSYTGFKDLKLSFAIQNAFNKMPPFVPYSGVGYYTPLHSAMGRYVQLTAEYKFK
ncbi:MAG: TonB-dependent receptor [Rhodoferax sp.]|nr:TonB-dependent receptor [Rhodoferax sp.]